MANVILLLILSFATTGCYYMQAVSGQWEVMRKRAPLVDIIHDPTTTPELAARLQLLNDARDFSIGELGLPDNRSYRSYSDIERDYVVWSVFAAPEFSLTPKQWCFPVAGCVSYRGYFSKAAAIKASQRLAANEFDVVVGGVAAYSTLGMFNDPILNTMMQWDDVELVALLFHELAHQVVYVKDDSSFNESFATAVEEIGVRRWLASHGRSAEFQRYTDDREYQQTTAALVALAASDLREIFAKTMPQSEMRVQKRQRLQDLVIEWTQLAELSGRAAPVWPQGGLNNAHLIPSGLYEGRLPQFRDIYAACEGQISCFYAAAGRLADLDREARNELLATGDLRCFVRRLDD